MMDDCIGNEVDTRYPGGIQRIMSLAFSKVLRSRSTASVCDYQIEEDEVKTTEYFYPEHGEHKRVFDADRYATNIRREEDLSRVDEDYFRDLLVLC
jgi:hypothetical protein